MMTSEAVGKGSGNADQAKSVKYFEEHPLSTDYYNILGIPSTATGDEIKKAYYKLSMKYHPDRSDGSDEALEKFKKICLVYKLLSNPELRHNYNRFGVEEGDASVGSGKLNARQFFEQEFGENLFEDIIGPLDIFTQFQTMMGVGGANSNSNLNNNETGGKDAAEVKVEITDKEKKEAHDKNVNRLSKVLDEKLDLFRDRDLNGESNFREMVSAEAETLKLHSFGIHILHTVGYIYSYKANEYLNQCRLLGGIPNMFGSMRMMGHTLGETYSALKSAIDVYKTVQKSKQMTGSDCTVDEKEKVKEELGRKGIYALWQGKKLDVESLLCTVCDHVLQGAPSQNKDTVQGQRRAKALEIVGEIYSNVKKVD